MVCNMCRKTFEKGNRPDGLPNGIGMELSDGTTVIVCAECVIGFGKMDKPGRDEALLTAMINRRGGGEESAE